MRIMSQTSAVAKRLMKMLAGVMFVYGCYSNQVGDSASTVAGESNAETETHYCHADMELNGYIRATENDTIATLSTTTVGVKVVVSGKKASVEVEAENASGISSCVRYRGIPLVDGHFPSNIEGAEGFTSHGFDIEIDEDQGWKGNPIMIDWGQTNTSGRRKFKAADLLSVQIGKGLYIGRIGKKLYAGTSKCKSPSEGAESDANNCTEYLYRDEGEYGWWEPMPAAAPTP